MAVSNSVELEPFGQAATKMRMTTAIPHACGLRRRLPLCIILSITAWPNGFVDLNSYGCGAAT